MNPKLSQIEERAAKAKKLAGEIAELSKAETTLQSQKAAAAEALAQYAPSGFILDNEGNHGDPETDAQLAQLNRINTKLDLLPGIRSRLQQELAAVERELSWDLERALADARTLARSKMDALRAEYAERLLPVCGGDAKRASIAVESIISQSEVFCWYDAFKKDALAEGATVAAKLQGFLKHLARFNAGEPIRAK